MICDLANRLPESGGALVIPECGHFLQPECADLLNEVAKFFFDDRKYSERAKVSLDLGSEPF